MLLRERTPGFTLIELLIVVIIVAVLAAVGVPLLSANVQRARASEAEAGAGTWRTAIRAYLAEQGGTFPAAGSVTLAQAGLQATDFSGRWFDNLAYTNTTGGAGTSTYCISVDGSASGVPAAQKAQVSGTNLIQRSMNEAGTLWDKTGCAGGGGNQLN